jgi:hypothetical protein
MVANLWMVVGRRGPRERRELVLRLRAVLEAEFASGLMAVPYETWLWIADALERA